MSDLQHQRLRHLFASAILELWKKETGSVMSVLIEGTVCLTAHGGKTTVIQLCDRFAGLVNGDCDRASESGGLASSQRHSDGHTYPAPATLRTGAKSRGRSTTPATTQAKDSNNNVRMAPQGMGDLGDDVGAESVATDVDDDECSLEGDEDADDGQSSMIIDADEANGAQSELAVPGIGSLNPPNASKLDMDNSADDSAIHDMSMNRTGNSLAEDSLNHSPQRAASKTPGSNSGNDLLLSSPHDYTVQVRNVIRQRLLNANTKQGQSYRGQTSTSSSNNSDNAAAASSVNSRAHTSPYYRRAAESSPSSLWIKREMPTVAASEAMATAARRLASQYAAAAASGQLPMTLMSPPPPLAMPVGLPIPGIPINASSFQNLLGMKPTTTPGGPVLIHGTGSPRVPPSTPDSKRRTPSTVSVDPTSAGTSADPGQSSSEQKIYRCDYCNKTFLFKSKYHEHLPVHTSARPFQCHLCTRTYKYKYDLRVHLRTHLGIPTKSTVCPFCAARFATNKFLRQHMREAHADQNACPGSVPAPDVSPLNPADVPTATDNGNDELSNDRIDEEAPPANTNESTVAAASGSPPPVAENVNDVGKSEDTEL